MPDKWVGLPVCVESMQGILADRKTKTRRVAKPLSLRLTTDSDQSLEAGEIVLRAPELWPYRLQESRGRHKRACGELTPRRMPAPYGMPGRLVYFREPIRENHLRQVVYRADQVIARGAEGYPIPWAWQNSALPGRFMPRRLARACATISDVRYERLVDISEADAIAEGLLPAGENWQNHAGGREQLVEDYGAWWDRLNAKRGFGWEAAVRGDWHGWVSVTSWTDLVVGWEKVQEMLHGN